MRAMELHPALKLDYHALAALFSRAFDGYAVAIAMDGASLEARARVEAIDLAASAVIVLEGELAGLVLVSRRGRAARVAAMGIVPHARAQGLGARVLAQVVAGCRARGDRTLSLEVIEDNVAAVKLYRSAGFEARRRLVGWTRPAQPSRVEPAALDEVEPADIARLIATDGEPDLPWQMASETIAQLATPHRAFRLGEAFAVVRTDSPSIALRSLIVARDARRGGHATRLLRALCAAHPGLPVRVPAIVPERGSFFPSLEFTREAVTQLEMRLSL
jgi:ribosomal protein S18 acetylase RimI-like enzyme